MRVEVTEITLFYDEPIQGKALINGIRVLWELEEPGVGKYNAWILSDEDWKLIETQPKTKDDDADLVAAHIEMRRRKPFATFKFNDASWPSE